MEKAAPPLSWLFARSPQRSTAWQYWVVDTVVGLYNTCLHYMMRLLPIDACSNVGAFLSLYSPFFFRESDARARKVWTRLRPDDSEPAAVDAAMRRLWRCVSRTMAEYSIIDRLWGAGRISVDGMEHLQAARADGKPLLIAAMHLGNWEVTLIAGIESGFAGAGIYLPLDNRFDMRLAVKARTRYSGLQVPAGPGALRSALRTLRAAQQPFVIYIDEFIRGRVQAPAFGRPLQAEGNVAYVARLAAMTDAVVIPAYCLRVNDSARFKVTFLPPVEMVRTGDREADALANTGRINAVIEPVVLQNLDQWYFALDFEFED